jgi:cytochrome c oxidase subunit 2
LGAVLFSVSGCGTQDLPRFGWPTGITPEANRMLNLWKGSAVTALAVGAFVLALILFACVVYRKRNDDLPRQVRYNLPIETVYTVVPFVIVAALFYYTARDETKVDALSAHPAVTVDVTAFRWNWAFGYEIADGKGGIAQLNGEIGRPGQYPTLVVPTGRSVRFKLASPDVNHSFWVPALLFKRDVIPGRINEFEVRQINASAAGHTYVGRCAELCGVDHDRMYFNFKVVAPAEYDRYIADLKAKSSGTGVQPIAPQNHPTGAVVGAPAPARPLAAPAGAGAVNTDGGVQ